MSAGLIPIQRIPGMEDQLMALGTKEEIMRKYGALCGRSARPAGWAWRTSTTWS